jgi:hypothetical protein
MGEFHFTYFSIFQMLIICIVVLHPRHKLSYFKNAGEEEESEPWGKHREIMEQ